MNNVVHFNMILEINQLLILKYTNTFNMINSINDDRTNVFFTKIVLKIII